MNQRLALYSISTLCKRGWPLLFWGWMIFVSAWIELAQVENLSPTTFSIPTYSNISFRTIHFEQKYENQDTITVKAAKGVFDSNTHVLHLEEPILTYHPGGSDEIIHAKGNSGEILASIHGAYTDLPSEFTELTLTGDTSAEGKNWHVDADELTLNNVEKRLYFPRQSKIRIEQLTFQNDKVMYYDFIAKKLMEVSPSNEQKPMTGDES